MTENLPWFAARLLFERLFQGPQRSDADLLFEERLVLVHAPGGEEAAAEKARKLGKAAFESYENADGETVQWVFREVLDVLQLDEADISEGSEVYHQFHNAEEVARIKESLKSNSI